MTRATLTVQAVPGVSPGRVVEVDCPHGRTTLCYATGTAPDALRFTDAEFATVALLQHYAEEGCSCTRELRRRFGLAATGT